MLNLHQQLLETVGKVERTYWQLVQARQRLAIRQRLLERTLQTRNEIVGRRGFDVSPIQLAQAFAFVERRRADVIQRKQAVRNASDQLKKLSNAPELPLSEETLIVPVDQPVEVSAEYSLLDSVTTAIRNRPEVKKAILDIDDASIRQAVAKNQRLPSLTLNAQAQYFGLSQGLGNSYDEVGSREFINYLVGAQFEMPIGNREREAAYRQAQLRRRSSVVQYRKAVREVVLSVKQALRQVRTAHRLIGVTRAQRRAAAENLRAIRVRKETGEALTPEFLLDLELTTQRRLARAERRELRALINYNSAVAQLLQAQGRLLEHNRIDFEWPENMFEKIETGGSKKASG